MSVTYLGLKSKLLFPSSQAQMALQDITQEDSPGQANKVHHVQRDPAAQTDFIPQVASSKLHSVSV